MVRHSVPVISLVMARVVENDAYGGGALATVRGGSLAMTPAMESELYERHVAADRQRCRCACASRLRCRVVWGLGECGPVGRWSGRRRV
jgi:hypothetical protein